MITLTPADVTQEILARFDREQPTMSRALAVLTGITRGEMLADDSTEPTWATVRARETSPVLAQK